jgi:hypothetical protein
MQDDCAHKEQEYQLHPLIIHDVALRKLITWPYFVVVTQFILNPTQRFVC